MSKLTIKASRFATQIKIDENLKEKKDEKWRRNFQLTRSITFIFQMSSFVLTLCTLWGSSIWFPSKDKMSHLNLLRGGMGQNSQVPLFQGGMTVSSNWQNLCITGLSVVSWTYLQLWSQTGTLLYGHPLHTGSSLLRTAVLVPSSYIFSKFNQLYTDAFYGPLSVCIMY